MKTIITKAYQTLGLIRCASKLNSTEARKQLYISLVQSQLLYCSPPWIPQLLKDIFALEHVQHRATKFILNDYNSSYKICLEKLHLLPLMYLYELNDLMFLVKSLKTPTASFNIIIMYTLPVMPPGLELLPNWFALNHLHQLINIFSSTEL